MSKFFLTIWIVILAVWAGMLGYLLWQLVTPSQPAETALGAGFGVAPVALPTPTDVPARIMPPTAPTPAEALLPTPGFREPANPQPNSQIAESSPPPPLPDGNLLTLFPAPEAVGWTSTIDGNSHFDDDKIHVGYFKGHVYHGALQFDLSDIPAGSNIVYAALELTKLSDRNLGVGGVWQIRLLDSAIDRVWLNLTYDRLRTAVIESTLQPVLPRERLVSQETQLFVFDDDQLAALEQRLDTGSISFRIDGPSDGLDNLFTWDARFETEETSDEATGDEEGNDEEPPVLTSTIKLTVVVETLNYVVVTSTPTPENVLTVAAQLNSDQTSTPVPANWVTPIIVTSTPTPETAATAAYHAQLATAEAMVYGTATPPPINLWTATPDPLLVLLPDGVPTGLPPTPTPVSIPAELIGKIAFKSDRAGLLNGDGQIFIMDADGRNIFSLKDDTIYEAALARDKFTADQNILAFVDKVQQEEPGQNSGIFIYDYFGNRAEQITRFTSGKAYQPAWSPAEDRIAFVSDQTGVEEIWAVNRNGSSLLQLTRIGINAFNRHPSWSPDGTQLVFFSDRTGRAQIWRMNADGGNQHILHESSFNDWSPVWIKYPDLVQRPIPGEQVKPPDLR